MLSPLFVFFSTTSTTSTIPTTSTTSTIPTTSGPFPQPHAILARISNSHLKASWSQNPFFYPVFSFDTFLSTKFQTPATLLIPVLLEGDDEKEYNDDDDDDDDEVTTLLVIGGDKTETENLECYRI